MLHLKCVGRCKGSERPWAHGTIINQLRMPQSEAIEGQGQTLFQGIQREIWL